MNKFLFFVMVVFLSLLLYGCGSRTVELQIPTSPPQTNTPISTNTHTPVPPTETQTPTPTIPPDMWLDPRRFELTVEYPQSTDQPNWGSSSDIVIPVDGYVGGIVFTMVESSGNWGGATSRLSAPENSVMQSGTLRPYPAGLYCVSDSFLGYDIPEICQIIAPGSIEERWITNYFAGYRTEVGVSFAVGGCDPTQCRALLKISNIQLIMYKGE